jgi:hypothetical protein
MLPLDVVSFIAPVPPTYNIAPPVSACLYTVYVSPEVKISSSTDKVVALSIAVILVIVLSVVLTTILPTSTLVVKEAALSTSFVAVVAVVVPVVIMNSGLGSGVLSLGDTANPLLTCNFKYAIV